MDVNQGRLIRVNSGLLVDVFDPKKGTIIIEDIAHGLSNLCRYGGQIEEFYSVAEHSVMVCTYIARRKPEWALEGLMHDATEAYLVDMPRPIKGQLPEYSRIENRLMGIIALEFGLKYPFDPIVKEADEWALQYEWDNYVLPRDRRPKLSPMVAKRWFLSRFKDQQERRK